MLAGSYTATASDGKTIASSGVSSPRPIAPFLPTAEARVHATQADDSGPRRPLGRGGWAALFGTGHCLTFGARRTALSQVDGNPVIPIQYVRNYRTGTVNLTI